VKNRGARTGGVKVRKSLKEGTLGAKNTDWGIWWEETFTFKEENLWKEKPSRIRTAQETTRGRGIPGKSGRQSKIGAVVFEKSSERS